MKRLILLLVVVVAVILTSCSFGTVIDLSSKESKGKDNILQNSSFENFQSENNNFENWSIFSKQEDTVTIEEVITRTGKNSILINRPETDISLISDSFEINNTSVYYSRCFVKTDKLSNKPLTLQLIAFNKKGDIVNRYSRDIVPTEEWTSIDFNSGFFKDSATSGRLVISVPEKNDNKFWIDDAEIFRVHTFAFSQE